MWDGIASICISGLLAAVSLKLVALNRSFILGKPVDQEVVEGIRKIILRRRSVDAVYTAQTQYIGPAAFAYNSEVDFDGTYLAAQVYSRYESEITQAAKNGTLQKDLKWLLPCFSEDVTRVLEKEVRDIQAEVRSIYKEAAFIDIVPDSSQTTKSALSGMMGTLSREAEHGVLLALLSESSDQSHVSNFNLGCAYQAMGQSEKALPLLQSCLKEREVLFGGHHSEVAAVLESLGTAHYNLGDNNIAKLQLERAVGILSLLPDTQSVSVSYSLLAW